MAINKSKNSSKSRAILIAPRIRVNTRLQERPTTVNKVRPSKQFRRHSTRRDIYPDTLNHKKRKLFDLTKEILPLRRPKKGGKGDQISHILPEISDLKWYTEHSARYMDARMRPIRKFIRRLYWESLSSLHIPNYWNIFKGVNWNDIPGMLATRPILLSDSSDPQSYSSQSSHVSSCNPITQSPNERLPIAIVCRSRDIIEPRTRNQWNFLSTIMPTRFNWRYQTGDRALRWNASRHNGFLDMNQGCLNQDYWPQVAAPPILSHWEADEKRELPPIVREVTTPCAIGRRIVGLVQMEAFLYGSKQTLRWPNRIAMKKKSPIVDYVCRATPEATGWEEEMCPLLFAAQFRPKTTYYIPSPSMELATVFGPTISLLILYYLDTRTSIEDPIPPWMVLFGITYDTDGVAIWGYSPWSEKSSGQEASTWGARIWNLSTNLRQELRFPPSDQGDLLIMLNRIQGHCAYVLDQLKAWDGYNRARQLLMV